MQRDKWAGFIDDPTTFVNKYAYCFNNPINWIDPWGQDKTGKDVGITLIGIGLTTTQVDTPLIGPGDIVGWPIVIIGITVVVVTETGRIIHEGGFRLPHIYWAKSDTDRKSWPKTGSGGKPGSGKLPEDFKPGKKFDPNKPTKIPWDPAKKGYPEKGGDYWEPSRGHTSGELPHWDVQHPDGTHTRVSIP